MGNADLGYLVPLFELSQSLLSEEDNLESFGLGTIDPASPLALDDVDMDGYWVSIVVISSITAAVDHAITLHSLVTQAQRVTDAAPWTLLRGVLEPASVGCWVLAGKGRPARRERALRVWHYDMKMRSKWEDDTDWAPTGKAKSGRDRQAQMLSIGARHGLRAPAIAAELNYADAVAAAARHAGLDATTARARWREASAFAHGRFWPLLKFASPEGAEVIPGGVSVAMTLGEEHHQRVAELCEVILRTALLDFARLAAPQE